MIQGALQVLSFRGPVALASVLFQLARGKLQHKLLNQRFIKRSVFDYQMLIDMQDRGISRSLLMFGERELDHKLILEKIVKPGMRILDIGANIGYYAIMERRMVGPSGRLVAVEPSPSNIELLKRNLALNGIDDVEVISGAVSDTSGMRSFSLSKMSNLNTFHPTDDVRVAMSGEVIDVPTMTVSEIAARTWAPDLMRMDVEGHEVEVINGMLPAILAGTLRPMIIFETHLTRYGADHDMAATLRQLFDCGYHVRYAASSWEAGTDRVTARGYKPISTVRTDDVTRAIFENIGDKDAIDFICTTGGLRTVLLSPRGQV